MKEFQLSKSLISILNLSEIKYLRKRLCLKVKAIEEQSIALAFFDAILNNSTIGIKAVSYLLYNKNNETSLRKLCQRLNDRILDVFYISELNDKDSKLEDRSKSILSFERNILLVDILRYRGLFKESDQILNEIIISSKEYEAFDILIFALNKKRFRSIDILSKKELLFLDKEITHFQKLAIAVSTSKKIFRDLIVSQDNIKQKELNNNYIKSISIVSNLYKRFKNNTIKYYLLSMKSDYESIQNQNAKSIEICDELLTLILENKNIYSRNRLGTAYLHKALYLRNSKKFDKVLDALHKGEELLSRLPQTKIVAYYQIAIYYFITGDLKKFKHYLNIANLVDFNLITLKMKERLFYLNSLSFFIDSKFREANSTLDVLLSLGQDDFNFDLDKKLLQIMINVELGNFDLCDKLIENFRKFVNSKSDYLNNSILSKYILKVLYQIKKSGYNFENLSSIVYDYLKVLEETLDYKNDFLLPFTPWFTAKANNVPYNHKAAMEKIVDSCKMEQLEVA